MKIIRIISYLDTDIHKKIVFMNQNLFKVTIIEDGNRITWACDISNIKDGIYYKNKNKHRYESLNIENKDLNLFMGWPQNPYTQLTLVEFLPDNSNNYPFYDYVGEGETETDEPATETIVFPPPETYEEFVERIGGRLYHLTQRISVLNHEKPHQHAKSEQICLEVDANHPEVIRYDLSCNLIKRPVGWLMLQIDTLNNRYANHLKAVETAKQAGTTPPTFNDARDREKIETMLEKLEIELTEECLKDHYDLHHIDDWKRVQKDEMKITLCQNDQHKSPGEILVDVRTFFTDGDGNFAEKHAKRTYHEISTKWWTLAERTIHRKLVTERTVTLA